MLDELKSMLLTRHGVGFLVHFLMAMLAHVLLDGLKRVPWRAGANALLSWFRSWIG